MGKVLSTLTKPSSERIFWRFYKTLDSSKHEIRVLTIHDAEDDDALVRCTIETVSLTTNCQYIALSYVWGQGANANIIVDNQIFHVTTNLALALKYLRKAHRNSGKLMLWVDAICINQLDLAERAQQVQMMGQIYRKAKEVAVWLGKEIPNVRYAFDFIEAALFELREFEPQGRRPRTEIHDHFARGEHGFLDHWLGSVSIQQRCQYLQAIVDFLSVGWFKRVWTIQEAVLNKNLSFHMMSNTVKLLFIEQFCNAVHFLAQCRTLYDLDSNSSEGDKEKMNKLKYMISARRSHSMDVLRTAQIFADNYWDNQEMNRLVLRYMPILFEDCTRRAATDERDKVFGLLGLMSKDLKLVPDYSATVEKVYENATLALMEWAGSLDLLYQCFPPSSPDMSSWIHDFRSRPRGRGYLRQERTDSESVFNCSLGASPVIQHARAGVLSVKGRAIDRVKTLIHIETIDGAVQTKAAIDRVARFCVSECIDITKLPAKEQSPIWRLLCGGVYENEETFYMRQYAGRDEALFARDYHLMDKPGYTDQNLTSNWIRTRIRDSVVFCTDAGRYGLGRMDVEAGDLLFMLQGAELPCALRSASDVADKSFTFRGGCYVDGVMNGECVTCLPEYDPDGVDWIDRIFESIFLV